MHLDSAPSLSSPRDAAKPPASFARALRCLGLAVVTLMFVGTTAGTARANDLSNYPCTAGDVEIVGSGIVVNEPCSCTPGGTFNAVVQFTVRNNTSTGRYCIALHLVQDGAVITVPYDVILRDANGSSTAPGKSGGDRFHDTVMFGTIPNFPCNVGVVCFGQAGVVRGKCDPGTCTTISWNTSPGAASCTVADESPPGGQCRHQQVCVVGYGVSLNCTAGCTPSCGSSATLQACVTAPAERGPFTFTVNGNDGSTATQSSFGDASGTTCINFNVSPTQSPTTTYTLTVTDKNGCTRTATKALTVTAATASIEQGSNPGCNGVLSFTASVAGRTGCTFTWTVDGVSLATFLAGGAADDARIARPNAGGNVLSFRALDNTCHTIAVSASCGSCTATASTKVKQCVGAPASCN